MEGFTSNFHSLKASFSFIDIDQNMELFNQFAIQYDNPSMSSQSFMGFSNDNFYSQQVLPSLGHHLVQSFQSIVQHEKKNVMVIQEPVFMGPVVNGKRKSMDMSSSSCGNSSSHSLPDSEIDNKKYQSSGKGKKVKVSNSEEAPKEVVQVRARRGQATDSHSIAERSSGKGKKVKASDSDEAPKEVVHVRARRGQATDSHSIAERVRRGKVNERLRCLQDIVPGCYKSMGLAAMLDEIINYVQSLQNQVELLSMKLTEASRFHNFDSDSMHIDAIQMRNVIEELKLQKLEEREENPVDLSFGSYHALPYHTTS